MKTGHNGAEQAAEFLRVAHLFHLGHLPTERPHPGTLDLSLWARTDLPRALSSLKTVDLEALQALEIHAAEIDRLSESIQSTLSRGRRVFLCGCGATGRLSLTLEGLWRQEHGGSDQVVSFMAGGDVALVHALEGFEDHPRYGARHLVEMGFSEGDLLVACTEGGETPYVLGATEKAAEISSQRPYLLYCNPDGALTPTVERFRRVHDDPRIRQICLDAGPMALAGSTRMQASTLLQLAVGLALLHPRQPAGPMIARFRRAVERCETAFLAEFIERESSVYMARDHVTYRVRDYGITVFTDTTERAPTFSLVPFERMEDPAARPSLCYVALEEASTPDEAWQRLVGRPPRTLDWPDVDVRTSPAYLAGFDFSVEAVERRRVRLPDRGHHEFSIAGSRAGITLRLDGVHRDVPMRGLPPLFRHLLLKLMLNMHSTLVMGRLGRYESNIMTWVRPSNGKLVDRAVRCVQHLLDRAGRGGHSYAEIVHRLFEELSTMPPDQSAVLTTYRSMVERREGTVRASMPEPARRPSTRTFSPKASSSSPSRPRPARSQRPF